MDRLATQLYEANKRLQDIVGDRDQTIKALREQLACVHDHVDTAHDLIKAATGHTLRAFWGSLPGEENDDE